MRRIPFSKIYNIRELGGFVNLEFKVTKFHQFLRSDALENIVSSELDFLKSYGIKVIIDLRNDFEVTKHPDNINQDFYYYRVPFLNQIQMKDKDGKMSKDLYSRSLEDIYQEILESKQQIKQFFDLIIKHNDQGILFHCSAGKDRTGILTYMLLKIAGISDIDIIADYQVSSTFLQPRNQLLMEKYPDMKMHILESEPYLLTNFIRKLNDKYLSIEKYLLHIGLSEEEIRIIRDKLI